MSRAYIFYTVLGTATRLLFERDKSANRTGAYLRARHAAEEIAMRNMRALDARKAAAR